MQSCYNSNSSLSASCSNKSTDCGAPNQKVKRILARDYTLPENKLRILQNIGEMSIFWQFSKKMSFSANYEGTF